jgi:hypothetical protein
MFAQVVQAGDITAFRSCVVMPGGCAAWPKAENAPVSVSGWPCSAGSFADGSSATDEAKCSARIWAKSALLADPWAQIVPTEYYDASRN